MDLPTYLSTNNELTMRMQQCARRSDGSNFELAFVSRIPQIRLKKNVTEIL